MTDTNAALASLLEALRTHEGRWMAFTVIMATTSAFKGMHRPGVSGWISELDDLEKRASRVVDEKKDYICMRPFFSSDFEGLVARMRKPIANDPLKTPVLGSADLDRRIRSKRREALRGMALGWPDRVVERIFNEVSELMNVRADLSQAINGSGSPCSIPPMAH